MATMSDEQKRQLGVEIQAEIASDVEVFNSDLYGPSIDGIAEASESIIKLLEREGLI